MEVLWQYIVVIAILILAIIYLVVRYIRRRRLKQPGCSNCALYNDSLQHPTVITRDALEKRTPKE